MKRLVTLLLLGLVASWVWAQDDPDLALVPVDNLPPGSRILAYAVVETESGSALVSEIETDDGTAAFFIFDYVDDRLVARAIGPRSIPGDLRSPPIHQPVTRDLAVAGDRFWTVDISEVSDRDEQLVSAPPLEELRFAEIGPSPWQLSPPPEGALAIRRLSVATDGTVLGSCVLEPNITAVTDRVTTSGAWWVRAFGEPHLLVGMLYQTAGQERLGSLRLYNRDNETVAVADPTIEVDVNRIPALVRADLSRDGQDELLFFATAPSPSRPLSVYRFTRRDGRGRVLSFNLCSVRMNGDDVVRLQRALEGRGFGVGPHGLDGWYGPDTRAAVIRFERAAGLPVDGVVDEGVRALLGL
ncbi:MAG: peptidoglycan-binding domain-containing protein [Spirochaetota bacterium]